MTVLPMRVDSNADLPALAVEINSAVRDAEQHVKSMVEMASRAGELLVTAKAMVPHGEWEDWLTRNCEVAPRTARAYMQVHEKISLLPPAERQRVADLPLREAMKAIQTPATPAPGTSARLSTLRVGNVEHVCNTLERGRSALGLATRRILKINGITRDEVQRTRDRVQAAIAVLDELLAAKS